MDSAPLFNIERIDIITNLYEQRKIENCKTALNVVKLLASKHKRTIDLEKQLTIMTKYMQHIDTPPREL